MDFWEKQPVSIENASAGNNGLLFHDGQVLSYPQSSYA
jgi:hypothetical protein